LASSGSATGSTNAEPSIPAHRILRTTDGQNSNVPAPTRPFNYYSILQEAIKIAEHNSSQLRALVYERARFNLKRDILYGHSSLGLADLVQQVKDFELAVARIEANAVDDEVVAPARTEKPDTPDATANNAVEMSTNEVEILPARRPTLHYAELPIRWTDNFQNARWPEEFLRHVRAVNRFTGFAVLGMAIVGTIVIAATLWPLPKASHPIEIASKLSGAGNMAVEQGSLSENAPAPTEVPPK